MLNDNFFLFIDIAFSLLNVLFKLSCLNFFNLKPRHVNEKICIFPLPDQIDNNHESPPMVHYKFNLFKSLSPNCSCRIVSNPQDTDYIYQCK